MTKIDQPRLREFFLALLLLSASLVMAGCFNDVEPFPEPEGVDDSSRILHTAVRGPIIVSFASSPMRKGAPPDGIRAAIQRSIENKPCSAATFFWAERDRTRGWLLEQFETRRAAHQPIRLILAGHGLGATEACELAKELMRQTQDVEIVLLLTVDAVKTNRIGSAAAVTGNALTKRIPGVDHNFTAYDAAPQPDGEKLWAHVNYYQSKSAYYHGTAMPYAENHRLDDWTGLLNHGNADDFAYTFLATDLRLALKEGRR